MKSYINYLIFVVLLFMALLFVDVVQYPEYYCSTLKYQLINDIEKGDKKAIQYYKEVYFENNRSIEGVELYADD